MVGSQTSNLSIIGLIEVFYEYLTYVLFNRIWFPYEKCFGFAKW